MKPPAIKMRYIPAQFRVRVEFTKAQAMASEAPPADLVARASAKLKEEQEKGALRFFVLYRERFEKVWSIVRQKAMAPETPIGVTLATGAPEMPGIVVTAPEEEGQEPKLTITTSPAQLSEWRFELFKLAVRFHLSNIGHKTMVDPAHLHLLYYKACQGKKIVEEPLLALPPLSAAAPSHHPFGIQVDPRDGVIKVIAYDVASIIQSEHALADVVNAVIKRARELKDRHGWGFVVLKEDIVRKLRSAGRGPEFLGVDLPLVLLGALRRDEGGEGGGQGHVDVTLSEDLLSASIRRVDPHLYEDAERITLEQWLKFFKDKGVRHGLDRDAVEDFMTRLMSKQSCEGLVIAHGTAAVPGSGAKLVPVYQDAQGPTDQVSLRERQAKGFVRAGQLVAEIRFDKTPRPGRTVTGESIEPENPEIPLVSLSDGLEARGGMRFYATAAGVPVVSDDAITLTPGLVVKQDVNLASGNIRFEGPIEIHGNIETGAVVETTSDLIVHGMIEGGRIRVGGNLVVDGGIIGGRDGAIHVKRDVSASFLDNARIVAGGNVTIHKTITASDVSAHGRIVVEDGNGIALGGHLRAWEEIIIANVGRANGAPTHLTIGHDIKAETVLAARERRLARLQHVLKEEKANLRTLQTKAPRELSKKNTTRRSHTLDRLPRLQAIVDRVVERVRAGKADVKFFEDACVRVSGVLSKSTVITMFGQRVPVMEDIRAVKVVGEHGRKGHVVPMEDDATAKEAKKAG